MPIAANRKPKGAIMRSITILVALLLLPCGAFAQSGDSPPDRKQQQFFLADYMEKQGTLEDSIASARELDQIMQELESAWATEAKEKNATFRRLGSYTYSLIIRSATVGDWAQCYVWRKYMVPAFLQDYEHFKSEPTKAKSLLMWRGNVVNTFGLSNACELPEDKREQFYAAYERMPAVVGKYLEAGAYTSEKKKGELRSMQSKFEKLKPVLEINRALEEGRTSDAFAELAAAYGEGTIPPRYLVRRGKRVAYQFGKEGQTGRALATLDLLARSNLESDLPPDSLQSWYTDVDPQRGPERFEQVAGAGGGKVLASTGEQANLSGQYTLLSTGETIDLSEMKGKAVVIDFWTTWCGPCIEEIPQLNEFADTYGKREDIAFITINGDAVTSEKGEDHVKSFMKEQNVQHPVVFDTEEDSLAERFDVIGWPTKVVINPEGEIMERPTEGTKLTLDVVKEYLRKQL
jgi:thiol-disulfide isomerase/thioredoxin